MAIRRNNEHLPDQGNLVFGRVLQLRGGELVTFIERVDKAGPYLGQYRVKRHTFETETFIDPSEVIGYQDK